MSDESSGPDYNILGLWMLICVMTSCLTTLLIRDVEGPIVGIMFVAIFFLIMKAVNG